MPRALQQWSQDANNGIGDDDELVYYDGGRVPNGYGNHGEDPETRPLNSNSAAGDTRTAAVPAQLLSAYDGGSAGYDEEKAACRGEPTHSSGQRSRCPWLQSAVARLGPVRLGLGPLTALTVLGTLALSSAAYFAGNRHCVTDQFGHGCGRIRWAAVQIKRKSIAIANVPLARPAGSGCNDALGIDRVALMFLSLGPLPQDRVWAAWLEGASGLIPLQPYQAEGCDAAAKQKACKIQLHASSRDRQFLFSFYSHTQPNFTGHGKDSVLYKRIVEPRVETWWGSPRTSVAERQLLREALREPRNQRFLMLSDSGVPLYPPTVVWQQLMSENKSRIDACNKAEPWWEWNDDLRRWNGVTNNLTRNHFRISSQFFMMQRPHAQLVAYEAAIFKAFEATCFPHWIAAKSQWYFCLTSEHYFPTMLSLFGHAEETDCMGHAVAADWSEHTIHPKTFLPEEITSGLLHDMRQNNLVGMMWPVVNDSAPAPPPSPRLCNSPAAIRRAAAGFVPVGQASDMQCRGRTRPYAWDDRLLPTVCPLIARKFNAATADAVLQVITQEDDGLGICQQLWQRNEQPQEGQAGPST